MIERLTFYRDQSHWYTGFYDQQYCLTQLKKKESPLGIGTLFWYDKTLKAYNDNLVEIDEAFLIWD